jgi:hypothetical protein
LVTDGEKPYSRNEYKEYDDENQSYSNHLDIYRAGSLRSCTYPVAGPNPGACTAHAAAGG